MPIKIIDQIRHTNLRLAKCIHASMVRVQTLRKRGQHSEHLGGLCGAPLAGGEDNTVPSAASTYMSAGSIRSFCTPAPLPYLFSSPMYHPIELHYSVRHNMPPSFMKHAIRSNEWPNSKVCIWTKLENLYKSFTSSSASITLKSLLVAFRALKLIIFAKFNMNFVRFKGYRR